MKSQSLLACMLLPVLGAMVITFAPSAQRGIAYADDVQENPASSFNNDTQLSDWCAGHRVPESECTQCNPSLIDKFKASGDWCTGHDIPESHCRLCNPGIQFPQEQKILVAGTGIDETGLPNNGELQTELDWCFEHSVPESKCTQCNPSLIDQYKASGDWCAGHDLPESNCRLCNPGIRFPQEEFLKSRALNSADNAIEVSLYFRSNASVCATDGALIQFASAKTAERSGISTQQVIAAPYESVLEAPAEVMFDESAKVIISPVIPALVTRWYISPGDLVQQDDILAILQSPNMAELQAELLSTYAEYQVQKNELDRHKILKSRDLISNVDYERHMALAEQAHAQYTSTRGLLLSTGINELDIDELLENGTVSSKFALRAPTGGLVAERIAQLGELLEGGRAFAILADPTAMWIEAQLTDEQMRHVSVGQQLHFSSDGHGLNRVGGEVIWVSPFLDSHTRTGTVRARVVGQSQSLHAGEFGQVVITRAREGQTTLVPKDAVQWEGCCNVVFVKEAIDRYRPRKVQLADGRGPYYQVTSGLLPGEDVVVDGSFLLKTELKKTSIGAGCCGIEAEG